MLSHSVMSTSVHGDSPGKKTRVGCHALLQGIFPTQGSHIAGGFFTIWDTRGSLRILELVAYPSLRELPDPGIELGSPALRAVLYQLSYQGSPSLYLLKPNNMVKILQARLQQYVNQELPDIQVGFRKDRGTRGQMANIRWIIRKADEFRISIYFCFIGYTNAFDCVDHNKL